MPDAQITEGGRGKAPRPGGLSDRPGISQIRWTLNDLTPEKRDAYHNTWFESVLKAAALNGATFYEVNDWQSCLVLMHPGKKVDNPRTWWAAGLPSLLWNMGLTGCRRMLLDYPRDIERIKHKTLGDLPFFYVFFIATRSDAQGQGFCSSLLKEVQAKAATRGCPVWLEATTARSRDIYLKLDFRVLEEVRLGRGTVDEDGNRRAKGEGVSVWTMLWEPKDGDGTATSAA